VLEPSRANRLLAYEHRGPGAMTLREMLDTLDAAVFATEGDARLAALSRVVQARFVSEMISLSRSENGAPGLDAVVDGKLVDLKARLDKKDRKRTDSGNAHYAALAAQIRRHLSGAEMAVPAVRPAPETPPGSPIGAMGQIEECWFCAR